MHDMQTIPIDDPATSVTRTLGEQKRLNGWTYRLGDWRHLGPRHAVLDRRPDPLTAGGEGLG